MSLCESIVSYWSLDEASGFVRQDCFDVMDLPEFVVGTPGVASQTSPAALVDNAARFGLEATSHLLFVSGGVPSDYQADASFYLCGWVKFEGAVEESTTQITTATRYGITYNTRTDFGTQGFNFQVTEGDLDQVTVATGALAAGDEWHFVFAWYDVGLLTINLQVDNGAITTAALGSAAHSGALAGFGLGGNTNEYSTGPPVAVTNPFGLDAWMFGKGFVLTAGERAWLYNDGNGRSCADLITFCELPVELSVDLSETLSLIIADPSGLLSDPEAIAPPGGSGVPTRFVDTDGGFTDSCDPEDASATVCTRTRRALPVALAAHLAGTALTLAYCLRLERRDGEVFGFTTHDANLTFGGVTYEALNSLEVTALRQEVGGGVGTMDLAGLIRSDRVTAADLLAGRYDGAQLTLLLVNWASLGDGSVTLARGWFGAVTLADGGWKAEYRSLAQKFAQEVVEVTSALCRVRQLGDARCAPGGTFANGASLSAYQFTRTVSAVTNTRQMTFAGDSHASGYYNAGRAVFSSGANEDLEREVKSHTLTGGAAVIELQDGFPFSIAIGDTAMLEAGCDRRISTCKSRFRNVVNYQAEPHVPGFDVTRRLAQANLTG